jgi:hypothetical protein
VLAVGQELHLVDAVFVVVEDGQLLAGGQVPQARQGVVGAGEGLLVIGRQGAAVDVALLALQTEQLRRGLRVPQPDGAIVAGTEDPAAVGGPADAADEAGVGPLKARISRRVVRSQSRAVLSWAAVARVRPSGEMATCMTRWVWPSSLLATQVGQGLAGVSSPAGGRPPLARARPTGISTRARTPRMRRDRIVALRAATGTTIRRFV